MDPAQPETPAPQTLTEVPADAPNTGFDAPLAVGGGAVGLLVIALVVWTVLGRQASVRAPQPEAASDEGPPAEQVDSAPSQVLAPHDGVVARMRGALGRTREVLSDRFDALLGSGAAVDDSALDDLEEALLLADIGIDTTEKLLAPLRQAVHAGESDPAALREALRTQIRSALDGMDPRLDSRPAKGPWVLLVVGVNGSGKTTTIGKLAARFRDRGDKVMLAAADTYRAAAADQLVVWAERAGADIVRHQPGADPGAVVYDALESALAKGHDVVIIDTAGRLQTRRPLMEQLSKVRRVIAKLVPDGPHETLLVLDGTMGQNGLSQARLFDEATPLSGVVVTKLDGTAKGGMILTIAAEMGLPVKLVGIGEKLGDLADFDPDAFAGAIA